MLTVIKTRFYIEYRVRISRHIDIEILEKWFLILFHSFARRQQTFLLHELIVAAS